MGYYACYPSINFMFLASKAFKDSCKDMEDVLSSGQLIFLFHLFLKFSRFLRLKLSLKCFFVLFCFFPPVSISLFVYISLTSNQENNPKEFFFYFYLHSLKRFNFGMFVFCIIIGCCFF